MIRERHLSDDELLILSREWIANFRNANHSPICIWDGIGRKKRTIIVPTLEELVVQYCIVNALKDMFFKGMYEHSYASIPGRGSHLAKKHIEKWIRRDLKNTKYVLKMDIHHFFDSISNAKLKQKLSRSIKDDMMLNLLFEIIDVIETGIPLGFYTSQWLSNWYLKELDHYIKEQLCAVYYVRYMDDMVIFGANKKHLHKIRKEIERYLKEKLDLCLKSNWQVFPLDRNGKGRELDFMGFRFYRNRTTIHRSIMYKMTRKAVKISKKGRVSAYDARQMLSYLGWIDCTDTYWMYKKRI
ncbi:MAG: RNA-directed DNA polymerase [Eubacteriales bacterium]|nr:RNA-directed DNA polymerase [Eubacteriales bacterium]